MGKSLTERRAESKPKTPSIADVKVTLDKDLSEQREALAAELEAAKAKNSDRRQGQVDPTVEIQERIDALERQEAAQLLTLRFTKLPGPDWADLTSMHSARPGAAVDKALGFNFPKVCKLAAEANAVLVDGEDITGIKADEWPGFWVDLSGFDVNRIFDAIWELNVGIPAGRLARLGKA